MAIDEEVYAVDRLSADIWGHRFMDGQRGPEYVLEFLNVLKGASYSFGENEYKRNSSVGLRKFIFEGVKEGRGASNPLVLKEEERQKLLQAVHENDIHILKQFLRNLEVVMYNTTGDVADRSWYAKTLYPLHESLLYVELRKKGKDLSVERNFFARGGELYFLMLACGTEQHVNRRQFIEKRFQQLLTKNKIIEKVVYKISSVFENDDHQPNPGLLRANSGDKPMLPKSAPEENAKLFEDFAIEMEKLLQLDLDIYEMFHLLTSLVCFQLSRYMHERALLGDEPCTFFVDCLDGNNKRLSILASSSFDQHENLIKNKFEHEFERTVDQKLGTPEQIEVQLPKWKAQHDLFFEEIGLKKLKTRKQAIEQILERCNSADDVMRKLKNIVREVVSEQMKKHQLSIMRVLARDGGFATYRRGSASNYRYTISDAFVQMLVFTKVNPKQKLEFHEFLDVLYRDYGIIIGEKEAKQSGIYDKSRLNVRYFQENEKALRAKLQHNGLLIEFSDATAMIQNPYACILEVQHA